MELVTECGHRLDAHGVTLKGKIVAPRPIWIEGIGIDPSGKICYDVRWKTAHGTEEQQWLPQEAINSREELIKLPCAPISLGKINAVSDWLQACAGAVEAKPVTVYRKAGWANDFFVFPNDEIEWLGPKRAITGSIEAWARPLLRLVNHGEAAYPTLICLGVALAATLTRFIGCRNPILSLECSSSKGKGTVIEYALSIWNAPASMTLPSSSTEKGLQDLAMGNQDLPLFCDELHKFLGLPHVLESYIYFLGNGQRRVTSSKAQVHVGGEPWHGAALCASERPILQSLNKGVSNRVIVIDTMPMPDAQIAAEVKRATAANQGVIGQKAAAMLNEHRDFLVRKIKERAISLGNSFDGLNGDDASYLALIEQGIKMISSLTGMRILASPITKWLAQRMISQRCEMVDPQEECFKSLVEMAVNGCASGQQQTWKAYDVDIAWNWSDGLDINLKAPVVANHVSRFGGERSLLKDWYQRGWIEKQGDQYKVKRGEFRVLRVTAEGRRVSGLV